MDRLYAAISSTMAVCICLFAVLNTLDQDASGRWPPQLGAEAGAIASISLKPELGAR